MENQTLVAIVGIASTFFVAIGTSIIASVASIKSKRIEISCTLSKNQIERRESLYLEFLNEVNEFMYKAFEQDDEKIKPLVSMMAIESKVNLVASNEVSSAANRLCEIVINIHNASDKQSLSKQFESARNSFSKACKDELDELHKKI